ncbi:hypothetical protein CAOG_00764 [Capsaspora owczarzaki ATCC 30864]|uniref:hypothetical protein n=1 Tax=Capsaspora owczarzaki (strain ATCC 30864) TaxID=595528 RepID=UPI0001FE6311|nr:hypothetical protein CAOG_00764 [Capsaspora owczarzaki ATCC 30864]|eukprot:XP_004365635.1 hypothetical protein CAOG_00764 [Capsaspora owczarzaki ATCC 30864]
MPPTRRRHDAVESDPTRDERAPSPTDHTTTSKRIRLETRAATGQPSSTTTAAPSSDQGAADHASDQEEELDDALQESDALMAASAPPSDVLAAIMYARNLLVAPPVETAHGSASGSSSFTPFAITQRPGAKTAARLASILHSRAQKSSALFPPLALMHQLYAVVDDRTSVDRELMQLKQRNVVRLFRLDVASEDTAIMVFADFVEHVQSVKTPTNEKALESFVTSLLPAVNEMSVTTQQLNSSGIDEAGIGLLMNAGLLTMRSVGSFWFAIPRVGVFNIQLARGRAELLRIVRKAKYKEASEQVRRDGAWEGTCGAASKVFSSFQLTVAPFAVALRSCSDQV